MRESYIAYGKLLRAGVPEPIAYSIIRRMNTYIYEATIIDEMGIKPYLSYTKTGAIDHLMNKIDSYDLIFSMQLQQIQYIVIGFDNQDKLFSTDQVDEDFINDIVRFSSIKKYQHVNINELVDIFDAIIKALLDGQVVSIQDDKFFWKKRTIS